MKSFSTTTSILNLLAVVLFSWRRNFAVHAATNTPPNLGGTSCSNCAEPGHFCGIDGQCHVFSCQNYYQYADPKLTGYADGTPFECFGYSNGDIDNAHGVIYGCAPLFPLTIITPGKQVTEPFNRKCTAEREGGYLFECYEFQPSETATNFDVFEMEAESSFPDCGEGKDPKYYYIIASSNHYVGFEGLQGAPIVVGGADVDGDTLWQSNEGSMFKRELAMYAMFAQVVGGPNPTPHVSSIEVGSLGGNNPLKNPKEGPHGGHIESAAATRVERTTYVTALVALGFAMMVQLVY